MLDEGIGDPLLPDANDPLPLEDDGQRAHGYIGLQQGYEAFLEAQKSKGAVEKVSQIIDHL